MVNELLNRKDMEGSGHDPIQDTIPEFAWRD
jgi:hypothetical protein